MSDKTKVCLYLEFYHLFNGYFFKKIGTGLLSSYKNQKKILEQAGIPYREKWDDSCDILQINTPWLNSLRLIKKAKRKGKKVVIWSHVTVEDAMQVFRFMPYVHRLFKKYLTYAYGLADIVLCPSEYTKSLLIAYGLPSEKLIAQSNGVDENKFSPNEEKRNLLRKKKRLEGVVVGTVGLVIPRKGVNDFIRLAELFPENSFLWYGKIYSSLMVKSVPKNIPPNLEFTGFVEDIQAAFNSLDVFLFPSFEENQGMVLLEAAAAGLPILARDIPAYRGWLEHNENCLKAKSAAEFETYLKNLTNDGELRKRLGKNARQMAEHHDIKVLAKKMQEIYKRLIQ